MERLDYPKKPLREHKTYKILPEQYPEVIAMRKKLDKKGKPTTIAKIAKKFGVGIQTISFILNPEKRAEQNKRTVERARERSKTDDDFRQSQSDAVNKYLTDRKKSDPKFKKYHNQIVSNANKKRNKLEKKKK